MRLHERKQVRLQGRQVMAAKKKASKSSKPAANHPWRSELKKHGPKHERMEGPMFERKERKGKGYSKGRERY